MDVGKKIALLRKERNWSQKDLAAAMEESPHRISHWEQGDTVPELDRLIHLSQLFEVSLQELTGQDWPVIPQQPATSREQNRHRREMLALKVLLGLGVLAAGVGAHLMWLRYLGWLMGY